MSWSDLWGHLNDPVVIAAIASLVLYALGKLYVARPSWARFEGTIISAIKFAEREIPDDTPNAGLAKLDSALRYVISVYERTTGKQATAKATAELKEGIQVVHDDLEMRGTLK